MYCEFEKTIEGISKYLNSELYPDFNSAQRFAARVLVGRILENSENVKNALLQNGYIRTFGVMDATGAVDVYGMVKSIKNEIKKEEKITFNVPWFGKMTFKPSDVDVLYKTITGEDLIDENN